MDASTEKHGQDAPPPGLSAGHVIWKGHSWTSIPGCGPVIWSVEDSWFPDVDPAHYWSHREWTICCYHTPCRLHVPRPGSSWTPATNSNHVYIFPPYTTVAVDSIPPKAPVHQALVHFSGGEEFNLARFISPDSGYARIEDPGQVIASRIKHMAEIAHELETQAFWLESDFLAQMLAVLNRSVVDDNGHLTIPVNAIDTPLRRDPMVDSAITFMASRLEHRVTMKSLAGHLRAGPSTVNQRYRKAMNETPLQTLRRLRVTKARFLIARGNSMEWVATQTGFCDAFHLSRVFKQATGLSPKAFLKTLRPSGPAGTAH